MDKRVGFKKCRIGWLRLGAAACFICVSHAQGQSAETGALPDAPSALMASTAELSTAKAEPNPFLPAQAAEQSSSSQQDAKHRDGAPQQDDQKKPLPQQKRIFGVLANFTTVSGGTKPKPAGWKTDFEVANRQNYDYTSIGFLFATSGIAYAENKHPLLNTVNGGNAIFYAYLWRGFLDKTDGTYQGAFFFPALLHEDTRYYALGTGSKKHRTLHALESVVVAHNYSGGPVFNLAGLAGKVGTQAVSTTYYPSGSEGFGVLAEKFAYAYVRQAGFTVLREFSPDLAALMHRHRDAQP